MEIPNPQKTQLLYGRGCSTLTVAGTKISVGCTRIKKQYTHVRSNASPHARLGRRKTTTPSVPTQTRDCRKAATRSLHWQYMLPLPHRVKSTILHDPGEQTLNQRQGTAGGLSHRERKSTIPPKSMPHASRPEVRRGASYRSRGIISVEKNGCRPSVLRMQRVNPLRSHVGCIATTLRHYRRLGTGAAVLESVCLQFLPGDEMGAPLPSACGRLVLFTGELPLMVAKHVEISPCLSLLPVCSRLALDRVFGVFAQNYDLQDCRSICGAISLRICKNE